MDSKKSNMEIKAKIRIGNVVIGEGKPVVIIAEAGINHNGKLRLARELVDAAKAAGANAVKFQTFKTENLVAATTKAADGNEKNAGNKSKSLINSLKKVELKYSDFISLKKYCDKKKIIFLSTPHSEDAVDFLEPLVPAYKIGSGDLTNLPFLEKIAGKKKPVILSTGMADLDEVKKAVGILKRQKNNKIILLHCTTQYPCPLDEVNLRAMEVMRVKLNCLVGYSDHTLGITVPIMARTLGAVLLEKHFTLDRKLSGPDHQASLEPPELKVMVKAIRDAEKILGSDVKKPTKSEEKIKKIVRKSMVADIFITRGVAITSRAIAIKRPAKGIEPGDLKRIIGKKARRDIKKGEFLTRGNIQI